MFNVLVGGGCDCLLLTNIYTVFPSLHYSPTLPAFFYNLRNTFFNFSCNSSNNTTSSANASNSIDDSCNLKPCRLILIYLITFSNTRFNKIDAKASPNLNPDFTCTGSEIKPPTLTLNFVSIMLIIIRFLLAY